MNKFIAGTVIATVATVISYALAFQFGWASSINWLEAAAVFFSYMSTYLCVVESRINYIVGAIGTAFYCWFFVTLDNPLYASAALNFYLPFALLYGWFRWGPDKNTRPVTWLSNNWGIWAQYLIWSGGIFAAIFAVTSYMGSPLALTDAAIVGFSVLAQLLLDNKRMETWFVWALVNVLAIVTYFAAGAPIAGVQYILFLANTIYGAIVWRKSMIRNALNG